ncbi:uncharacterized protein DNG_06145 [Cephalotrichum gorgonifer]|uniref:Uncharacterized protein n=1 Tax=Cephalotrichum gorgonifer TaxID=2041049 RepID=A0AAE8N279_9PEZI|nr:uncharacterized protein DNG_06145 [Cephalotrichum gorgonifer]
MPPPTPKNTHHTQHSQYTQRTSFTETMLDRQARGKDPYVDSEDESFDISDKESFRVLEQKRAAARILSNPELLMMHAMSRKDSIPGTRLHFTRILCGYGEEHIHRR